MRNPIPQAPVTRATVLAALRDALEPLPYVYAMWEGGAAGFDRVDEWSDIDVQIDTADDHVVDVFAATDRALSGLSPIELKYELPQPTWHGHAQAFYRLRDASPFLFLDFVVIKHSNPDKLIQPEIHGRPVVRFDKAGVVAAPPLDRQAHLAQIERRLQALRACFDLFQVLTLKEIHRGNPIEAIAYYQGQTLRPLVEALRIRYNPIRYNFFSRYVYYELPPEVVRRLEPLFFVAGLDDLRAKREAAERFFHETIEAIDLAQVAALLDRSA
ncbi:MAG TPA: nucleotidyltransferase domain-containing protein [Anaerolineae bacterium]|nr:nucleotidyltransferase domain-containing protein [Anaerolineae bacterium]HOR01083.1 nucleotidyltransferase domain-containing protein [Anaerolineae bacterium]HPL30947.1 nucleotidyltransferase domain-containing protein [Anaerolineae bacterium]